MTFDSKAYQREWLAANKEKKSAYNAAYRAANKEKQAVYGAAYREANKEKKSALAAAYYAANKEKWVGRVVDRGVVAKRNAERQLTSRGRAVRLCAAARCRARGSERVFALDIDTVVAAVEAGVCEATGLQFDLSPATSRVNPFAPSLDRIDCSVGYTPENTRVVLTAFNLMRNAFPDEVLEVVSKAWLAKRCQNIPEEESK